MSGYWSFGGGATRLPSDVGEGVDSHVRSMYHATRILPTGVEYLWDSKKHAAQHDANSSASSFHAKLSSGQVTRKPNNAYKSSSVISSSSSSHTDNSSVYHATLDVDGLDDYDAALEADVFGMRDEFALSLRDATNHADRPHDVSSPNQSDVQPKLHSPILAHGVTCHSQPDKENEPPAPLPQRLETDSTAAYPDGSAIDQHGGDETNVADESVEVCLSDEESNGSSDSHLHTDMSSCHDANTTSDERECRVSSTIKRTLPYSSIPLASSASVGGYVKGEGNHTSLERAWAAASSIVADETQTHEMKLLARVRHSTQSASVSPATKTTPRSTQSKSAQQKRQQYQQQVNTTRFVAGQRNASTRVVSERPETTPREHGLYDFVSRMESRAAGRRCARAALEQRLAAKAYSAEEARRQSERAEEAMQKQERQAAASARAYGVSNHARSPWYVPRRVSRDEHVDHDKDSAGETRSCPRCVISVHSNTRHSAQTPLRRAASATATTRAASRITSCGAETTTATGRANRRGGTCASRERRFAETAMAHAIRPEFVKASSCERLTGTDALADALDSEVNQRACVPIANYAAVSMSGSGAMSFSLYRSFAELIHTITTELRALPLGTVGVQQQQQQQLWYDLERAVAHYRTLRQIWIVLQNWRKRAQSSKHSYRSYRHAPPTTVTTTNSGSTTTAVTTASSISTTISSAARRCSVDFVPLPRALRNAPDVPALCASDQIKSPSVGVLNTDTYLRLTSEERTARNLLENDDVAIRRCCKEDYRQKTIRLTAVRYMATASKLYLQRWYFVTWAAYCENKRAEQLTFSYGQHLLHCAQEVLSNMKLS